MEGMIMKYFKVLGDPVYTRSSSKNYNYKGIYRKEPFPNTSDCAFLSFWQRESCCADSSTSMGITNELTLEELFQYAELASKETGKHFEVVYFSENESCPYKSVYYGIDVIEMNGYSMLGDGLFNTKKNGAFFKSLNRYVAEKLNRYGLFFKFEDALEFRKIMEMIESDFPGSTEAQPLHIVFVYKIVSAL